MGVFALKHSFIYNEDSKKASFSYTDISFVQQKGFLCRKYLSAE